MSKMTVDNMVISTQLSECVSFSKIHTSSYNLCYEPELFFAALLSSWSPVHVAIFHNSKVIVTGLKSHLQVETILDHLIDYVHTQQIVK